MWPDWSGLADRSSLEIRSAVRPVIASHRQTFPPASLCFSLDSRSELHWESGKANRSRTTTCLTMFRWFVIFLKTCTPLRLITFPIDRARHVHGISPS